MPASLLITWQQVLTKSTEHTSIGSLTEQWVFIHFKAVLICILSFENSQQHMLLLFALYHKLSAFVLFSKLNRSAFENWFKEIPILTSSMLNYHFLFSTIFLFQKSWPASWFMNTFDSFHFHLIPQSFEFYRVFSLLF